MDSETKKLLSLNNRYFQLRREDRWIEAEHILRQIKVLLGKDPFQPL